MSITMYQASVPQFIRMLGNLKGILDKAAAHAADRKIDESVLLNARLYPDMFPLTRQVQIATDFARGTGARLAGVEPPAVEDREQSFAELSARTDSHQNPRSFRSERESGNVFFKPDSIHRKKPTKAIVR